MAAVIVGVEIVRRRKRTGQKTAPQRRVRHEPDAEFAHRGEHAIVFRLARPQRIFCLHRGDGMHGVRAANGGCGRFRQPEEAHLALLDQARHCAHGVFDGHIGVDAVLVVQVDMLHAQPTQAGFACGLHICRAAVDTAHRRVVGVELDAEFGGQKHFMPARGNRLADQHFIGVRAVHVGGVEQADATIERAMDHRDRGGLVAAVAIECAHPHAAKAQGRNGGAGTAKRAGLHGGGLRAAKGRGTMA